MRKGYRITLGVLTIMILITITIGTSYSYYSVSDVQTTANTFNSTCFNITYNDNGGSSAINLTNTNATYPMSDTNALTKLTPYSFTITNTCSEENQIVNYVVTLNTLTSSPSTLTSSLKYRLDATDPYGLGETAPTAIAGTIGTLSTPYPLNPKVKEISGYEDIDTSYSIGTGTLAPGKSKTFNLRLWISDVNVNCTVNADESVTCDKDLMGKNFAGKVLVYSYI